MENSKEKKDEINFLQKQNEITDYTNKSNMNMVFLFQIVFIFVLIVVILLYLEKIGILTSFYLYGSIVLFGFIVFLIFYNRVFITAKYRDSRNFDRINFGDNTYVPQDYKEPILSDGKSGSFSNVLSAAGTCRTQTVCETP